ncbi:MAG: 1-acyl-sn-glycerol-3-phosphate acyltransferase [Silvanigrellaceae bacterium]|nr:1-acyl-sn-glycerol-3-phosphate acyltransferase [Silvanigrellaceae bacterium]
MYKFLGLHFSRWVWLFTPISWFFRLLKYPSDLNSSAFPQNDFPRKLVIYILPKMSILDVIVLNKALKQLGQPKVWTEAKPMRFRYNALLALKSGRFRLYFQDKKNKFVEDLYAILKRDPRVLENKIIAIPVSIYWSRAPHKDERKFILKSLFPDDGSANVFQKLLMCFLHRGEVNVYFGKTFPLQILNELPSESAKRLQRMFSIEFNKEKTAVLGPALYDNETIYNWLLSSPETKKYIEASGDQAKTEYRILKYFREISASYNYVTIRALEIALEFVWTRMFEGVKVCNFESISRLAKDSQIIWMPCHRSHFDYLLLSYVLFKRGLVIPHVAAGINLNFWPIGAILRKGGAFFIRRSFSGNKDYVHAFTQYVNFLLQNSFPIEFFQEGGRSRIGKSLPPKTVLLSLCVNSIIQRKASNTYIIPVYFGYDKVMEDDTYAKELKGAKKRKENIFQLFISLRKLFKKHGSVAVSFGQPIHFGEVWQNYFQVNKTLSFDNEIGNGAFPSNLHDMPANIDIRAPQLQAFVKYLAKKTNQKINASVGASGTGLLAAALLAQEGNKISKKTLSYRICLMHWLFNEIGLDLKWNIGSILGEEDVSEYLKKTKTSSGNYDSKWEENTLNQSIDKIVNKVFSIGLKWEFVTSEEIEKQTYFARNPEKEMNLWWYRGCIFHILAIFGIVARLLLLHTPSERKFLKIVSKMNLIRMLWDEELFWDEDVLTSDILQSVLKLFSILGLISYSDKEIVLSQKERDLEILDFLSRLIQPEIEIYGIQLAAALNLSANNEEFTFDVLMAKSINTHSVAFLRSASTFPVNISKVFGGRCFDFFMKAGFFYHGANNKIVVDPHHAAKLSSFLSVSTWMKYVR